jgi:glycosyltransferase involved in cell wall biosynthesis
MRKRRILFNGAAFSMQEHGGVSRYFCRLLENLHGIQQLNIKLSLLVSNNLHLKEMGFTGSRYHSFLPNLDIRGKKYAIRTINKLDCMLRMLHDSFDIFHPTYYDPYFLAFIGNKPFVLTVFDMIHELFPHSFLDHKVDKYKDECIKRAAKIIAISQKTKDDIIRLKNVDPSRIAVIHLGPTFDQMRNDGYAIELKLPERYLLFVGTRTAYKNFDILIRASKELTAKCKDLHVVCAGGGPFRQTEEEKMLRLGVRTRFVHIAVKNDYVLASLYRNAAAFVFPSLYEGFGLPILESFSCGCPIVLSNASCFPEIAEDAAIYFDPADEQDLVESIFQALLDKKTV